MPARVPGRQDASEHPGSAAHPGFSERPAPQLRAWVRARRSVIGWVGLILGIVIAAAVALVIGVALVVLAVAAWIVRGAVWVVLYVWAWIWYLVKRTRERPYPFVLRAPVRSAARSVVLNDAFLNSLPRTVGMIARIAGFAFVPLALAASVVGIAVPVWRARPYLALFSLPALERKIVGLGNRHGLLRDGTGADVVDYDAFLADHFPQRADFVAWWRNPDAPRYFQPDAVGWQHPSHFSGLALGPYPDALGYPGLAAAAMRRTQIGGLRELFISQREIDDLGDPNLDDRPECAVIRTVQRKDENGIRHWIVQFPSTQVWHPRAGVAPNDITADFVALSRHETTLTRAGLDAIALAGIERDDRVLLAGFSLGGMVAGQVAGLCEDRGITVTHLITAGSSIGRDDVDPAIHVLSMEHILDPVPRLEGRENPIWLHQTADGPEWITVKAGPPLPHGYKISATHHSPSYAETAGAIEQEPPDERVQRYLDEVSAFFGPEQQLRDFAATRSEADQVRPAVPISVHATADDGSISGGLRATLRRVPGVIAVDIYRSRTGFPTTVLWSADVLVRDLRPWFADVERIVVYRGLLSLLKRRRAVGIHLRLQAKESPGVIWEATMQRTTDGRWRECVDVSFATRQAEDEYLPVLLPRGWASRINYYPADAFA